ncbi:MAG: nickel pincer cofactor biosynthesis protein LarB [Anaerolineae bacterium]|nr:MAG: nickel pincer cofactor biosynthesis protein LarB [Anaerolineae bacterium]
MDADKLEQLLLDVQAGRMGVAQALERLRALPYEDLGHTRLDVHRSLRQGLPEVVYCQNKTVEQVVAILERLWQHHDRVLATRVSDEMAAEVQARLPAVRYDPTSRLLTLARQELPPLADDAPYGMVVSGGTSDLPVAEEAAQTLEFFGSRVERAYDVGVAGLHRLLAETERLLGADVVISVAGMEGALTSIVAGLVGCPVIGVPTSVGYGANFEGLAPLLTMLNSCASGVAVVNIDNGFGAGVYAHLILRRIQGGKG